MESDEMLAQLKVAADLCRAHGHLPAEEACNKAAELLGSEKPAKKSKKD